MPSDLAGWSVMVSRGRRHPFDVAILPPDLADDFVRHGKLAGGSRVDLARTGMGS
jgi:hypothetical protein